MENSALVHFTIFIMHLTKVRACVNESNGKKVMGER